MIVDTSAVLAVLFNEDDAANYSRAISEAESRRMSAANFVEAAIVVETQTRSGGSRQFDAFFRRASIVIEPVTEEQAHVARQAYTDFGKGRHRAGLNFGDCFAYALAKVSGRTLVIQGRRFQENGCRSRRCEGAPAECGTVTEVLAPTAARLPALEFARFIPRQDAACHYIHSVTVFLSGCS